MLRKSSTITHSDKQISSTATVERLCKTNALWTSTSKSNRKTDQTIASCSMQVATLNDVLIAKSVVSELAIKI